MVSKVMIKCCKNMIKFFPRLIYVLLFSFHITVLGDQADIIVFSYDRPMQLYAFLESLCLYISGIHEISVIYRCSDQEYGNAYRQVHQAFPHVKFVEQKNPPDDFKFFVIQEAFKPGLSKYVAFAVDDIIVKDEIDLSKCIDALETAKGYGFYLRLGRNIDDCWSSGSCEGIPPLTKIGNQMCAWQFNTGQGNWAYPNTLDMTIYRKKEIEMHFRKNSFYNPNSLENSFGEAPLEQTGLCYETSKIVNIPLNIVSNTSSTRHLNIPARDLLVKFNEGLKIDISMFYQMNNKSAHLFIYNPSFIPRSP